MADQHKVIERLETRLAELTGGKAAPVGDLEVISGFPDQVIILKGTGTICALSGRKAGLRRRMIDAKDY